MSAATVRLPASPPDRDDWASLAEVARIIGRHVGTIKSIALAGGIRTRALPGERVRYSRADARRLAAGREPR